jgi:hypothetical protein
LGLKKRRYLIESKKRIDDQIKLAGKAKTCASAGFREAVEFYWC